MSSSSSSADKPKPKVIVSLDVEADGPAPSVNSCLMMGFVVVLADVDPLYAEDEDKRHAWIVEEKQWCLKEQPGCKPEEKTMIEFWSQHQDVMDYIQARAVDITVAMREFAVWFAHLEATYEIQSWACAPASFDWMWLSVLYHKYAPEGSPTLPHSARCLKSIKAACRALNLKLVDTESEKLALTHFAVDDARKQAYEFLRTIGNLAKWSAVIGRAQELHP